MPHVMPHDPKEHRVRTNECQLRQTRTWQLVAVAAGLALAGGVIAALPGDAVTSASASTYTAVAHR